MVVIVRLLWVVLWVVLPLIKCLVLVPLVVVVVIYLLVVVTPLVPIDYLMVYILQAVLIKSRIDEVTSFR